MRQGKSRSWKQHDRVSAGGKDVPDIPASLADYNQHPGSDYNQTTISTMDQITIRLESAPWIRLHSDYDQHNQSNQSKRKTSNANGQTNLGHKHKAPDHNHEATQPMVDLPHTS